MESSIETTVSFFLILIIFVWSISGVIYFIHLNQQQEYLSFLNSCAQSIALEYLNSKSYNNVNIEGLCNGKIGKGLSYYVKIEVFYVSNGNVEKKEIFQLGNLNHNFSNEAFYYAYYLQGNLTRIEVYVYGEA